MPSEILTFRWVLKKHGFYYARSSGGTWVKAGTNLWVQVKKIERGKKEAVLHVFDTKVESELLSQHPTPMSLDLRLQKLLLPSKKAEEEVIGKTKILHSLILRKAQYEFTLLEIAALRDLSDEIRRSFGTVGRGI